MPLRIANWNLDRAKQRWRRNSIGEMLAEVDAAIWVLTESRDSVTPGADFRLVAKSSVRAADGERWVSIWTRLPVVRDRPTRDSDFAACAEILLGPNAVLAVYGTVLPWRGSKWGTYASANADAYRAALSAQAEDWHELVADTRLVGVCVAGDFNQDLSDTPYYWSRSARALLEQALDRCQLTAITRDPTDPVRLATGGAKACIDHMCLSRSLADRQVGSAQAWAPTLGGRELSDHPGVWIELEDA